MVSRAQWQENDAIETLRSSHRLGYEQMRIMNGIKCAPKQPNLHLNGAPPQASRPPCFAWRPQKREPVVIAKK